MVGATAMELDRRAFFEKELDLRMSMSYGPGRYDRHYEELGLDYPIAYVRWTENRNLQAFFALAAEGRIEPDPEIGGGRVIGAAVGRVIESVAAGAPSPFSLDEIAAVSLATFACAKSVRHGHTVELDSGVV